MHLGKKSKPSYRLVKAILKDLKNLNKITGIHTYTSMYITLQYHEEEKTITNIDFDYSFTNSVQYWFLDNKFG